MNVLVTGANRGIGLGFVKEFLKDSKIKHVFGASIDEQSSKELREISDPRMHVLIMDVRCDESIKATLPQVEKVLNGCPLDVLVNNAGVMCEYPVEGEVDRKNLLHHFDVNCIGALVVSQVFLPLLRKSKNPKLINISSLLGSNELSEGSNPRQKLPYSMTKSAMNQLTKSLAIDYKDEPLIVVSIHPGHVKTQMGEPDAEITVEESVSEMVKSLGKLTKEHSGKFFERNLEPIPY